MKAIAGLLALTLLVSSCKKIEPEDPSTGYGVPSAVSAGTTTSPPLTISPNTANSSSAIGVNLAGFGASTPEWLTIDQMVQAEDWQEMPCGAMPADASSPGSGTQVVGATGWVEEMPGNGLCVGARLFQGARGHYPKGVYRVLFSGGGTLSVAGDASVLTAVDVGVASFEVASPTSAGVLLKISALRAGDPIKDIRVIAPGGLCGVTVGELDAFALCKTDRGGSGACSTGMSCFDFTDVALNPYQTAEAANFSALLSTGAKAYFHPTFLQSLKAYRSLGFRRWLLPQGQSHADRGSVSTNLAHFTDRYVPFEIMLALSNVVIAEPWLNLPADVGDALLKSLADTFAAGLNANLRVYVEYAGNHWSAASEDRSYLENQAATEALSYEEIYVKRAADMKAIWNAAFGARASKVLFVETVDETDTAMPERVQAAAKGSLPFDLLASTARFALPQAAGTDAESLTQFFEAVGGGASITEVDSELGKSRKRSLDMANVARGLGLPLFARSAGPELVPGLSSLDARETARDDSRMGLMLTRHMNFWKDLGGQVLMMDKSSDDTDTVSSLPWGVLRQQEDDVSTLAPALTGFINDVDCWWTACSR